jgi:hypothetical protein
VARLLAGALVVASLCVLAYKLAALAMAQPRFQVSPESLVTEALPAWMPAPVAEAVRADLRALPPVSIFSPSLESTLVERLTASPWIAGVPRIERMFPNRVRIEIDVRRPVAVQRDGDDRLLLDADGRVLHRESARTPAPFPYPVLAIEGTRAPKPPRPGEVATDDRVRSAVYASAEILDHLALWRERLPDVHLAAIDLDRDEKGTVAMPGEVILVTRGGVRIRWGRPARSEHFGLLEPPIERKIDYLARVNAHFPGLFGVDEVWVAGEYPSYRPSVGGAPLVLIPPVASAGLDS